MAQAIPVIVMLAATAASTAVSIAGQQEAADTAKKASQYNAKVAENNAMQARQQASAEAERIRQKNRRVLAAQRSNVTKSGFTMSGSFLDVAYDSAIQGELDAMTSLYQGSVVAADQRNRATLLREEGDAAQRAVRYSQAGSLLTGASAATSMFVSKPK
jgi:hypothetical protein